MVTDPAPGLAVVSNPRPESYLPDTDQTRVDAESTRNSDVRNNYSEGPVATPSMDAHVSGYSSFRRPFHLDRNISDLYSISPNQSGFPLYSRMQRQLPPNPAHMSRFTSDDNIVYPPPGFPYPNEPRYLQRANISRIYAPENAVFVPLDLENSYSVPSASVDSSNLEVSLPNEQQAEVLRRPGVPWPPVPPEPRELPMPAFSGETHDSSQEETSSFPSGLTFERAVRVVSPGGVSVTANSPPQEDYSTHYTNVHARSSNEVSLTERIRISGDAHVPFSQHSPVSANSTTMIESVQESLSQHQPVRIPITYSNASSTPQDQEVSFEYNAEIQDRPVSQSPVQVAIPSYSQSVGEETTAHNVSGLQEIQYSPVQVPVPTLSSGILVPLSQFSPAQVSSYSQTVGPQFSSVQVPLNYPPVQVAIAPFSNAGSIPVTISQFSTQAPVPQYSPVQVPLSTFPGSAGPIQVPVGQYPVPLTFPSQYPGACNCAMYLAPMYATPDWPERQTSSSYIVEYNQ